MRHSKIEIVLAEAGVSWEHVVHDNTSRVGGFRPVANETIVRLYRQYMPNHAPQAPGSETATS